MRNILGFFVIVLAFCGLESAMNINEEHDLCTSLCSQLSNDFPEENPEALDMNQVRFRRKATTIVVLWIDNKKYC